MNARSYEELVKVQILRRLAEAEGNLLASAEEREASIDRLIDDVKDIHVEEELKQTQEEVSRSKAIAEAMKREAGAIRKRAVAFLVETVSEGTRSPPPSADDLEATLAYAVAGTAIDGSVAVLSILDQIRKTNYKGALEGIDAVSWPAEIKQAHLDLVRELLQRGSSHPTT